MENVDAKIAKLMGEGYAFEEVKRALEIAQNNVEVARSILREFAFPPPVSPHNTQQLCSHGQLQPAPSLPPDSRVPEGRPKGTQDRHEVLQGLTTLTPFSHTTNPLSKVRGNNLEMQSP